MAANTAGSKASAAARTFAIPELMEHILKCVANDGRYIQENSRKPAIQVFALRRVSQDFNNVIASSKTLHYRMHEAPTTYGRVTTQTHCMSWHSRREMEDPELEKIRQAILRAEEDGKKAESWENIEYWPRAAERLASGWIWWELGLIVIGAGEGNTFGDVFDIVQREKQRALERAGK